MCSCEDSRNNISEYPELKAILPPNYLYSISICNSSKTGETHHSESTFRINITTKDEALSWIEKFKCSSNAVFNKDRTFPENSQRYVYKVYLKCIHNTRPKSSVKQPHEKHTNSPAKLLVTVKRTVFSKKNYKSKSTDVHLPEYPMIVTYRNQHNHNLHSADAIKYHPLNPDVKNIFHSYFEKGLTPAKAIEEYKNHLKEIYGENYYMALADGAIYPDKKCIFRLYDTIFKKEYGECSGEQMLQALESYMKKYNDEMRGRFSEMKKFDDGNFIVVIVTPLMKRILENLPETKNVLFADSTGNVDTYGSKLYIFLTNSSCGGLPVGCLITTSECEDILNSGLELYKTFLNRDCFGGRGLAGPEIIMTDDSKSERNSFQKAFPSANLLLCIFHVLQASWRYIMKAKNGITFEDKKQLYFKIKTMIYSSSEEELNVQYESLLQNAIAIKYPIFLTYIQKMYQRRFEWAKCFRRGLITRGQDTNNICEAAMRIVKDNILNRTKAYSTTQLFSYITKNIDSYYEDKLISISNGRPPSYLKKKFQLKEEMLDYNLIKIDEDYFQIKNNTKNKEYYVNTDIGICTCPQGENGAICKHQIFISKKFDTNMTFTTLPADVTQKSLLLFLATGKKDVPCDWFKPLKDTEKTKNSENKKQALGIDCSLDVEMPTKNEENITSDNINRNQESFINDEDNKSKIINDFLNFSKMIADKAQNNDETLIAVQKFLENTKNLKTENSLNSALHCFGKFNGFLKVKKRKLLASSRKIGVQCTALARRKTLYGGRSTVQSGRPPKRSFVPEHGYCEIPKTTLMSKKKILKVPHKLSDFVENNR